MNKKLIIIIFCLFLVFFSAISFSSASDLTDNETVSVSGDEVVETPEQQEILADSPGSFDELDDLVNDSSAVLELNKSYAYSSGDASPIKIDKDITIEGKNNVIDGSGQASIFAIEGEHHVVLQNIVFKNALGVNGGAINVGYGSSIAIINCTFINNTASVNGGAVYINSTDAILENLEFTRNNAEKDGAALYVAGNHCNLANSTFSDNTAGDDGPAVYWEGSNGVMYNITCTNNRGTSKGTSSTRGGSICLTGSNVTVRKSSFTDSFAGFDGGALFITGNDVNVIDCNFDNCTARDEHGGAIYVIGNNTNILDCDFNKCNANLSGGVIYVDGNGATIAHATFTDNGANLDGAALYVSGDNCLLANSTFTRNVAGDDGGAVNWAGDNGMIYNITCVDNKGIGDIDPTDGTRSNSKGGTICLTGSHVTIDKSTFTQSSAVKDGGALFITGNDNNVYNSTFDDCTSADTDGGAIYIIGNNTHILGCGFSNCNANLSGGVIYAVGDALTIDHATFEDNSVNLDGGALYVEGDDCVLANSTFTGNIAGDDGGAVNWAGDNGIVYNITFSNNKGIGSIDPVDGNRSNSKGGTICLTGSNVTIDKSTFTLSSATVDGGALFITGNDVNVYNTTFEDCASTESSGGAMYIIGNGTNVLDCNFSKCDVDTNGLNRGGAIYVAGNNGTIGRSSFKNTQALIGGAIFIAGDDTTVDNSLFRYNDASGPLGGSGGAVYIEGSGGIVSNSDFAYGTTVNYGGAISIWGPNALITNNTFDNSSTSRYNGGTIFVNGVNTTISHSNFSRSKSMGDQYSRGGAIDIQGDNTTILDCNFYDCQSHFGGVIYVSGANAVIDSTNVNKSKAYEGGAIYVSGDNTNISKSNFTDIDADNYGGAIYLAGDNANISQSNFDDCTVKLYHGGAIYISGEYTVIEDSNFTSCVGLSKIARGGAIDIQGEHTSVTNSNFIGCKAVEGGSIFAYGNYAKIEDCIFNLSNAQDGGAIYLVSWGALINGSNISKCNATLNGGAIYVAAGGPHITESNFEDCLAKGTANGNGGGAIFVLGPDTHISDSTFNNNRVTSDNARGGAIYITGERTFIEGSDFNKSYAGQGGVIYIEGEDAIINASTFANSSSKNSGGAISVSGHNSTIEWSTFDNISAKSHGGAIYVDGEDTDILHSSFTNCTNGKNYGGAIYINDVGTTIAFSNFTISKAGIGGSIYISGENTTITYCNLDNNTADTAGAIKVAGANTLISNCNMSDNLALTGSGGAMDLSGRNASVYASFFENNDAKMYGGAINWEGGHGDDSIIGTTFVNNSCHGPGLGGGAVYWTASKNNQPPGAGGLIENSIFINNTAYGHHGGAIDWFHAINSTINNCLFVGNRANSDGGALYTGDKNGNSVNFTISNSQFYNNTAGKHGGAIANQMQNAWVFNNTFDGNVGYSSGGTIVMKENGAKNSVIDHCYIYNSFTNQADKWGQGGGAIHIGSGDTNVTIINSAIINSTANKTYGGAIAMDSAYSSMYNVTIQNVQTCDGDGGAIYWIGNYGTLNNVTIFNSSSNAISNARSANGGAIHLSGANCELNDINIASTSSNINVSSVGKTNYGGAIYVSGGSNVLTNITIDDSNASSVKMNTKGGAIYWSGASGTLMNASISNTLANGQGGAIFWSGSNPKIDNISIEYSQTKVVNSTNSADGGAIYTDATTVDLNNVYIENALASRDKGNIYGGAIYYKGKLLNNVTVIGSRAVTDDGTSYGGAVYLFSYNNAPKVDILNSSFEENTANYGGALYSNRNIFVVNTSFVGNVALDGGAVYHKGGSGEYHNATFANNSAKRGGAVYVENLLIKIYDSTLKNNTAEEKGGAIYYNYINTARENIIQNTQIINNTAFSGSAIFTNRFNKFILTDVVLLDNQANSMKFIDKVIGVDEEGRNYTAGVFLGYDNLLNAMWCNSDVYDLVCNNVTYWDANGRTVINSKPEKSNREAGQNVTIELFNENGEKINETNVTTDHNGRFKFVFDAEDGKTYFFAYTHKTDRYYTYLRETYSNSSLVKVYVLNPLYYGQNQTILITLTDGAWGDISGNVTVKINDTKNTTFVVEVINGTATIENVTGFALGDYNVTAYFRGDLNHTGDTDWNVFTVLPYDDLHITKGVNITADYVNVTDTIKYVITVTNHGPSDAEGVNVTEILSPYLKLLRSYTDNHGEYNQTGGYWYIGDLAVDENATLTIIAQVIHEGPITNTVWVTGIGNDTNLTNDIASAHNFTALPIVDLWINKTVNVTSVDIGVTDIIQFTIFVKNDGPCNATGVYVNETLDPCLEIISNSTTKGSYDKATWLIDELNSGENATLTIVARVVYAGIIENVVIVKSHENDTNLTNNIDDIALLNATAHVDLAINKTVNLTGKVNVTDLIKFTISVTNNGPCNAVGVYVSEVLDSHLKLISYNATNENNETNGTYKDGTWLIGNLNLGEVHNLTIIAQVISVGTISNVVTIAGYDNDTDMSNNNASIDNITALPIVDLMINKTVKAKSNVLNVTDTVEFTITVTNNGPCDATGVNVTEVLSPHLELISASAWSGKYNETTGIWDIGDLEHNVTTVLVIHARVSSAGIISNVVVVRSNENDTNMSNNKDEIENITALPIVDLAINKLVDVKNTLVNVTDKIKFTIIVRNNGPCDATDVYVNETLSPYLKLLSNSTTLGSYDGKVWHIGNLTNNDLAMLTIEAEVIGNGSIANEVVVHCHENDTNPYNDHSEVYLTALRIVDLGIIKKVNVTNKVNVTDVIEFNITVYNNGPCNATGVYVSEILSPHLTIISNKTTIGEYDGATWKIGNLNAGDVHNLTIVARVNSVGTISNAVVINGYQNDTNMSNNNDIIDNITALPIVDVEVTKTVDIQSGFVNVSDYIVFTIHVKNNGPCTATNVNVSEVLSPHLRLDSNTTWIGYYNVTDGVWYIGELENNVSVDLVLKCEVISAGTISNVVVVTSTENDTNMSNNKNNITNITALPIIDLEINKTVNVSTTTVNVTNVLEFTITVKNNGPCNATDVYVNETLSPYLKLLYNNTSVGKYDGKVWYIGNMTNGSTVVMTIRAEVIGNGSIENRVNVTGYENDTNPYNNHDEVFLNAVRIVDLVIDKQVNVTTTKVEVEHMIKFTVTVRNDGPCNATDVFVREPLDPSLVLVNYTASKGTYDKYTWDIGDMDKDANESLVIVARVAYSGLIRNDVEVFSSQVDTNLTNNKDNITPLNASAHIDLAIKKTTNATRYVNVTDLINFTITVTNNGPCNASGVYVSEILDPHLKLISYNATNENDKVNGTYKDGTWNIGLLEKGAVHNLTIIAQVIKAGNITNVVTINGYGNDSNSSNNNASIDNFTALPIVDLEIIKTVDVSSTKVNVTDVIEFTITVKNNGPCDATNVNVTEELSKHLKLLSNYTDFGNYDGHVWHIGDIANGSSAVLFLSCEVISAGTISNVVVANSTENDTDKSNNRYNITNITALPIVDLQITKEVNVTTTVPVNVTDKLKFTITVKNNGPCNATDVYVNETLSPYLKLLSNHTDNGTYNGKVWYIGNLTNGSSVVLTIEAQVIGNGSFANMVNVTGYENETNPLNNHAEVYLNAVRIVDLKINKTVNVTVTNIEVQDIINFTITVTNDGPCNATGVYVSEPLSPSLEIIRIENSTGTYDGYTWHIGDLNNGTNATLVIVARVAYSGIIENNVEVFSSQIDTNLTNNKDNITPLNATAHVDLAINKTVNASGFVNVTDFIKFTITVTNNGPCNATGVFVGEILDTEHLKFISYNATNENNETKNTYDGATWQIGNLNVGQVYNLTIIAQVIKAGNITNVVNVDGFDDDKNTSNNNASIDNLTALSIVDLEITKTVDVQSKYVYVGDYVTFTIHVQNNGPCVATNVNVTEVLSSHLRMDTNNTWIGYYNVTDGVWYIGNLQVKEYVDLVLRCEVISAGIISNVVVAKSSENDTNKSNNNDSIDNITALPIVDVMVIKSANSLDVNVTENVTYTIRVVNFGPCNATDVNVTEYLSPLVRFISADAGVGYYNETTNVWHIGDLPVNTPVILNIVCKVMGNGTIENKVVVDCHEKDTNIDNNYYELNVTSDFIVDLGVTKDVNVSGYVNVTDLVEFTITVYNNGPCNATNVYVGEVLSPHLILVSSNATKGRYESGTWRVGNLTVGEVHNLTIVAQVISVGIISNVVVVDGKEFDTNRSNNNASIDNFTALPVVDLEITKDVNVDTGYVNFGDEIVFSINVVNRGPSDATNVNVSEVLSPHLKLESHDASLGRYNVTEGVWYIGDLPALNSAELILYCKVISVGTISNVVVVNSTQNDTNEKNNRYNITNITALPIVDLQISKEMNVTSGVVNVTDKIKFTITVKNNGPCNATDVNISEELASNLKLLSNTTTAGEYDGSIWHIDNLANQSTAVLTIEAMVIGDGMIENVVVADSHENDTDPDNNMARVDLTAYAIVDLMINKTVNVTSTDIGVMNTIEFTITVHNNGPCNATGVYVSEGLSPCLEMVSKNATIGDYDGYTWTIDNLENGSDATLIIVARVVYSGVIENEVVVYSYENDTDLSNNRDNITALNATAYVDLAINKTVNVTGKVNVTDKIKFTITVTNYGPCNATGVIVGEILNSNLRILSNTTTIGDYDGFTWHIGNLDVGAVHNLTIIAEVISVGNITNAVSISGYDNDSNPSNNNASIPNITALPIVDLEITKEVNVSGSVNVSDFIEFTITVKNNGPCNATGVYVSEILNSNLEIISNTTAVGHYDGFTWTIGNLTNGTNVTLTIVAQVISNGTITNDVTATSIENDTNKSNNNDSIDEIKALPIVDVSVVKTTQNTSVIVGENITYVITVHNDGPSKATGVEVVGNMSSNAKVVHASDNRYDASKNIWFVGDIDKNETLHLTLIVKVIDEGTIKNSVVVTSNENDTNKSNNNDSAPDVNASYLVDLAIIKKSNLTGEANVGDLVNFTIDITNNGPNDGTNVYVVDVLPQELKYVDSNGVKSTLANGTEVVTFDIGNLTYKESISVWIVAKVMTNGTITNVASVNSTENETGGSNKTTIVANPIVDVEITKTANVSEARFGDEFTYTITVHNNGPSTATNVSVTEKLSNYVTLISCDADKGSYDVDKNEWYVGKLADNETSILTLTVKVTGVGVIENVVNVTSNENDTNLTNNNYTCDNVTGLKLDTPMDLDCYDIDYGDVEMITVELPVNATGTVNITVGDKHYEDVPIDHGHVVLPVEDLAGGQYNVTVSYGGNGIYNPNSTEGKFTVRPIAPVITIEVEDIWVGEVEILNVTVNAPGSVNVTVNGITVTIPLDNGVVTTDILAAAKNSYLGNATWNIIGLPVGTYPAFALYLGNENYTSVNTSDVFHVRDKNSTVVVTASDIHVGEDAIIDIQVGPEGVSGNVTVTLEGKKYILPIDENGKAQLLVPGLKAGLKNVSVEYNGTILYRPSENSTTFNVLKLKPAVDVVAPEITVGEDGVIIVTVPEDATGTITIEIEGKRYTAPIVDGEAVFIIPGLKAGVHDIKVFYSGDDKYLPGNTTGSIKVNPKDEPPIEENKTVPAVHEKVGLEVHETGNPIVILLLVILAIGSTQIRRFEK